MEAQFRPRRDTDAVSWDHTEHHRAGREAGPVNDDGLAGIPQRLHKLAMASRSILRGSDRGHAGFLKDVDGRTDETYTPEIPALGRGRAALPVVTGVVRAQTYSTRPVRWTGGRMELACAKRLPQILSTATA